MEPRIIGKKPGIVFDALSNRIIGAAIAVHMELGPGFLESVYEQALKIELTRRGIAFESQKTVQVAYAGQLVGAHVLDLFVEGKIVVELKAVKALEDIHFAQVMSYLRATNTKTGLLMNFNSPILITRRVSN